MKTKYRFRIAAHVLLAVSVLPFLGFRVQAEDAANDGDDGRITALKKLSLEQLMDTEVTSASRGTQSVAQAATAISVVTSEEIRRSGVTTIADALRLSPGVFVARSTGHTWAVTARGFNAGSSTANKMQVLMDGRILYNPLFSGVFWDVQNYPLDDIDRIEVIRGPGAALWGANAYNGVINIVTKSAAQTQGTLVTGGYGNEEQGFGGVRYGGKLGEESYYRVYVDYFNRDGLSLPNGTDLPDDMMLGQTGFRTDSRLNDVNDLTVQGDYYDGVFGTAAPRDSRVSGENLLGRWNRTYGPDSRLTLQLYYDRTYRSVPTYDENLNTFDIDLQDQIPIGSRQLITWGFNYQLQLDDANNKAAPAFEFDPEDRDLQLASIFVQDQIAIVPDLLHLNIGSKFERDDFSGYEVQPSIRAAFTPSEKQTIWAGVSRAVRTASRLEVDLRTFSATPGGSAGFTNQPPGNFDSEGVVAFELGYRVHPISRLTFDVAAYYNRYDHVRTAEVVLAPGSNHIGVQFGNEAHGDGYGVEFAEQLQLADWWTLRGSYSFLKVNLDLTDASTAALLSPGANAGTATERDDPENMVKLHSSMNLPFNLEFDQVVRYMDTLPNPYVPSYLALDLRLGWHPWKDLEISIAGQNLLDNRHPEGPLEEVDRSIYGKVTWQF
jgi:iron complex outermembrane receptor protein